MERVAQLQRALQALQLASDRREQTERKLRLQLENELRNERARNNSSQDALNTGIYILVYYFKKNIIDIIMVNFTFRLALKVQ